MAASSSEGSGSPQKPRKDATQTAFIVILIALLYQSFALQKMNRKLLTVDDTLTQTQQLLNDIKSKQNHMGGPPMVGFQGGGPGQGQGGPGQGQGGPGQGQGGPGQGQGGPGQGQGGPGQGQGDPGQGMKVSTDSDGHSNQDTHTTSDVVTAAQIAANVSRASDVVKTLATLIVLEYQIDNNLSEAQNVSARKVVGDYKTGKLDGAGLKRGIDAMLTSGQKSYLKRESAQVNTKIAELMEISGKDDKAYGELLSEFLEQPIRADKQ